MKKIFRILGLISVAASPAFFAISCSDNQKTKTIDVKKMISQEIEILKTTNDMSGFMKSLKNVFKDFDKENIQKVIFKYGRFGSLSISNDPKHSEAEKFLKEHTIKIFQLLKDIAPSIYAKAYNHIPLGIRTEVDQRSWTSN